MECSFNAFIKYLLCSSVVSGYGVVLAINRSCVQMPAAAALLSNATCASSLHTCASPSSSTATSQ